MAKPKTKKTRMDTEATEVFAGTWEFSTDIYDWRYESNRGGLNLHIRKKGEVNYNAQLYATTLNEAAMFAWGFDSGVKHGKDK